MNLLSFGEIIWDVYQEQCNIGGAPLNLAAHFALQGGTAWIASAVGNDTLGKRAFEHIQSLDLKTEYVSVLNGHTTGQCIISLKENGIPSYKILEDVAYDCISLPNVLNQTFDVMAFGTLALRSKQNKETLNNVLNNNCFGEIYTDLNIRAPFYSKESIEFCLTHATIVKISDEEMPLVTMQLFGKRTNSLDATKLIAKLYPKISLILVTQGEKGSFCYDCQTHRVYECKAEPASVVSTVGAGDSFGATFLAWYLKTQDIMLSMNLASKVSAFVVSYQEAIPADTKEFIKNVVPI